MQCEIVLFGTCPKLLGVTQQGYSSHDPVVRGHCCLQEEGGDVGEVCALGLLVHRALVEPGVLWPSVVHCVDMHHRQWNKQDFVGRFCKPAVLAIPACPLKEETVDIDTFLRR